MDAPRHAGFRPRFLGESAVVALLLAPVLLLGAGISAEWDLTKLILVALLYGWLGRRIARRAGAPSEAALAGGIAGGLAALVVSAVQIGTVGPMAMTLARDLLPPALVPAFLGAYAVLNVAWSAALGAAACSVGFFVMRSETSDANLRRLFTQFLWLRGALHADPVESAKSLSGAAWLERIDDEARAPAAAGEHVPFLRRLKDSWDQLPGVQRGIYSLVLGVLFVIFAILTGECLTAGTLAL